MQFSPDCAKDILYISDLDGTLLLPDGTFPEKSKARLNHLINDGMKFTIATARNYDSAHPILKGLNIELPVVLFNGVYLADFHTGNILKHTQFIDKEVVDSMLGLAQINNIEPFIYTFGEQHQVYYRQATNAGSQAYLNSLEKDGRVKQVSNFLFQEDEQISGFLLIGTLENLNPIYQSLNEKHFDHLNLYFAEDVSMKGYFWLQSFHQQANKGNMVEQLVERINFPLSKTLVFGDYLNDLDMFRVAGYSVAMENALPEVKESANQIIGSNSQGAVLNFLEAVWTNS
ncbi:MAG: HAD family hydrolase [Nitrospina sp.]|mgnify:CR=1 FL=1|nr:HAD family hydrolase [Nitrospina sp.]MBT6716931.1 HAD family hydrolase [Nitrospina sp.]